MIPFNRPPVVGTEIKYLQQALDNRKLSGDGPLTKQCSAWFEKNFSCPRVLLTTSCTHALEMAAILAGIEPGDEVIMPSYTFVSTANAFVLRGAKIVFVDIRPDTMNIDEKLIEAAITPRTKAIVPVHYAGVSCEMDTIMNIAKKHKLLVIEDAAQGVMSTYKGKRLGTIGDIGCYSFHETKNYSCGEGGAILLNNPSFIERAEIIREKGTDRSRFFRGQVDKYSWVDVGSSYLPSELNAAYLLAQLEMSVEINDNRKSIWEAYFTGLKPLAEEGLLELPYVPAGCEHNAHMFYIKTKDMASRGKLIEYLKDKGIMSVFHYIPLHSSAAGCKFGTFVNRDVFTTLESERLLRLPIYYQMDQGDVHYIIKQIENFYASIEQTEVISGARIS